MAVESVYVVYDLAPAVYAEVHVYIRHGDTFGVQEAFKEEGVFDRVNVGYMQAVGNHAARRTAAAGAYGYTLRAGVADKVGNDEKIVHKAHVPYHFQLIIQLPVYFLPALVVLFKAPFTELSEILKAVVFALRQLEAGQVIVTEGKVKIAFFGDESGVVGSFLLLGEDGAHLLLALYIKLLRLKAQAVGLVHGLAHLHAH